MGKYIYKIFFFTASAVIVSFSLSNSKIVEFSLWPVVSKVYMPLFLPILLVFMIGFMVGSLYNSLPKKNQKTRSNLNFLLSCFTILKSF